jgi:hypothetical protein
MSEGIGSRTRSWFALCALALASALAPTRAHADPPIQTLAPVAIAAAPARDEAAPDVVITRDGTASVGRVAEVRRNASVTLSLPEGLRRTIALADIVAAMGPALDASPPLTTDAPRTGGRARTALAPLEVHSAGGPQAVAVVVPADPARANSAPRATPDLCWTPCRLYVPSGVVRLLFRGPGAARVPLETWVPLGGLRARVHPVDGGLRALGNVSLFVGVPTALVGGVIFAVTAPTLFEGGYDHTVAIMSGTVTLAGLGLVALGIALIRGNAPRAAETTRLTPPRAAETAPLAPPRAAPAPAPAAGGGFGAGALRF